MRRRLCPMPGQLSGSRARFVVQIWETGSSRSFAGHGTIEMPAVVALVCERVSLESGNSSRDAMVSPQGVPVVIGSHILLGTIHGAKYHGPVFFAAMAAMMRLWAIDSSIRELPAEIYVPTHCERVQAVIRSNTGWLTSYFSGTASIATLPMLAVDDFVAAVSGHLNKDHQAHHPNLRARLRECVGSALIS
jgi:hypothetical protein